MKPFKTVNINKTASHTCSQCVIKVITIFKIWHYPTHFLLLVRKFVLLPLTGFLISYILYIWNTSSIHTSYMYGTSVGHIHYWLLSFCQASHETTPPTNHHAQWTHACSITDKGFECNKVNVLCAWVSISSGLADESNIQQGLSNCHCRREMPQATFDLSLVRGWQI